jgi:hypothetical protein
MSHQVGNAIIYASTDAAFLNQAWKRILEDLAWHEHTPPYPEP